MPKPKAADVEFSGVAVVQGEPTVSVGVPVARSSLTVDVSETQDSAALVPTSAAFDDAVRPRKKRVAAIAAIVLACCALCGC